MDGDELQWIARNVLGRALLVRVAESLAQEGISVAPLKGVVLHALGRAPSRHILDVDVLVAPNEVARARTRLIAAGLRERSRGDVGVTFFDPESGLELDVHGRLFQPGLFRMPTDEVLGRAERDRELFGCEVLLLDVRDFYAHLIGHFVRSRSNGKDRRRLSDIEFLGARLKGREDELARHLLAVGMGRAARYVLTLASEAGDPFASDVLSRLKWDRAGDVLVAWARRTLEHAPGNHPKAIFAAHALNSDELSAIRSLIGHLGRGLIRRLESPSS